MAEFPPPHDSISDADLDASQPVAGNGLGPAFFLPLAWLIVVVLLALCAPLLGLQDPEEMDFEAIQATATGAHWLGTDTLGRDLLARTVHGARVSLFVGLTAPALGMGVGLVLGILAGYRRGRIDAVIVSAVDILLAIPALVLLLLVTLALDRTLTTISVTLGFLFVPWFTRITRANTLAIADREFIVAARAMGASDVRILLVEIFPNVVLPVLAFGFVAVAAAIVIEGGLSFLALSVPPPTPSWGGTISEGVEQLEEAPHVCLTPLVAMFLTVLSFNMVGDTLRQRFADVRESALG